MANSFLTHYNNTAKKIRDKIVSSENINDYAPSPSEKIAREEIKKLTQNTEEIKKIKERIEKKEDKDTKDEKDK